MISQLELIFDKDQTNIKLFKKGEIDYRKLIKVNNDNLMFVKDFIKMYGFPYIDVTSKKAYDAVFLVVQHSSDVEYMKNIVAILEKKMAGQINKPHIAYLTDRIRVIEKRPQVYGTQYKIVDGKIVFFQIEDFQNINYRRNNLGMTNFEDYKRKISST